MVGSLFAWLEAHALAPALRSICPLPSVTTSLVAQLEAAVQVQLEEVEGERMMPAEEESLVVEVALPQAKPASREEGKGESRSRWSRRNSMQENGRGDTSVEL